MKKVIILLGLLISVTFNLKAQQGSAEPATGIYSFRNYNGKTYIFDANTAIRECSDLGVLLTPTNTVTAMRGSRFYVVHVDENNGDLTIKFIPWKHLQLNRGETLTNNNQSAEIAQSNRTRYYYRQIYNYNTEAAILAPKNQQIPPNEIKYFIVTQRQKSTSISEYVSGQNWNISFGTFTWPFKFRPTKSVWKDNVSLGATVSAQYKFSKDWAIGGLLGFSLSSVSLDSASTAGYTKTSTDRPAYSPSLSVLLSYKNVNITFGGGIDWINRPTPLEQSWIFHGKPWLGLGIGINLFTNKSTEGSSTKASDDQ